MFLLLLDLLFHSHNSLQECQIVVLAGYLHFINFPYLKACHIVSSVLVIEMCFCWKVMQWTIVLLKLPETVEREIGRNHRKSEALKNLEGPMNINGGWSGRRCVKSSRTLRKLPSKSKQELSVKWTQIMKKGTLVLKTPVVSISPLYTFLVFF